MQHKMQYYHRATQAGVIWPDNCRHDEDLYNMTVASGTVPDRFDFVVRQVAAMTIRQLELLIDSVKCLVTVQNKA